MTRLNSSEKNMIERLEKMSIKEAKIALANKEFGDIGSPNHKFCSSWLEIREDEFRDKQSFETLRWARHAAYAAYAAAIIAAVSIIIAIIA